MILIVCVDDDMGMMFNGRRQSQDKELREYILRMTADSKLWMNSYSAKQFDAAPQINVCDDFISEAAPGEYCFAENIEVSKYERYIERIILFKWNRRYPGDLHFRIDLSSWKLVALYQFSGTSHETITEEVYLK